MVGDVSTSTIQKDLTPDEWVKVEKAFSGLFGNCELLIDGFQISLERRIYSKNKLTTMVFVDGIYKGEWDANSPQATKFFHWKTHHLYSARELAKMRRAFGKKFVAEKGFAEKVFRECSPCWSSFKSFKRHIRKHNQSIQLVSEPSI